MLSVVFGVVSAAYLVAQGNPLAILAGLACLVVFGLFGVRYWTMTIEVGSDGVYVRQLPTRR